MRIVKISLWRCEFHPVALALLWSLCLVVPYAATSRADNKAVTIFTNGTIVTVDPAQPEVAALGINEDGLIVAVGDLDSVNRSASESPKYINLLGKTLMPGFVEPHTHVVHTAYFQRIMKDLSSFTIPTYPGTIQQIQDVLKKELTNPVYAKEKKWLLAFGVDPSRATPFMASLNAELLDAVQEGVKIDDQVPIFVLNQSEHIGYVNTKAMRLAGINGRSRNPTGGVYVRKDPKCDTNAGADCPLTGELHEEPAFRVFLGTVGQNKANKIEDSQWLEALGKTYTCFASAGVTTATELKLGTVLGVSQEFGLLSKMIGKELRIRGYMDATANGASPSARHTMKEHPDDEWLSLIGVKFGADGSTQGLTGALTAPYDYQQPGEKDNRGTLNYTNDGDAPTPDGPDKDDLYDAAVGYVTFRPPWQLSMHSNGDRALNQVLNVYEELIKVRPHDSKDRRWRIEHLTVTNDEQLKRIRALGLTASMTMGHVYYWGAAFGTDVTATAGQPAHKSILGARAQRIDPAKSLLGPEPRIRFSFNSDSPVSPVAPLQYIATAVTRQEQAGPVLGKELRITVDEAIRAVTLDAAYQLFFDETIGSIEVGKLADFVILSENPRASVAPADIKNITVLATFVGGVQKYGIGKFGAPGVPDHCVPTVAPPPVGSPLPRTRP
jgi:predicted amidohydrolase YtcJ